MFGPKLRFESYLKQSIIQNSNFIRIHDFDMQRKFKTAFDKKVS